MDTRVMFGIQYREEDHNPHLSWKDKTDLRFSVISSFDSVIVVYIRLSCELSNPNSISKQPMQCFFCRQEQCWGLFCSNIFVLNSRQDFSNIWSLLTYIAVVLIINTGSYPIEFVVWNNDVTDVKLVMADLSSNLWTK